MNATRRRIGLLALSTVLTLLAVLAGTTIRGEAADGPRGVLPVNRHAGPVGTATMHGDAGSSDTTPYAGEADPASSDFVGGMQRFRVGPRGCKAVWTQGTRSAAVPKLSTGEGGLYTVTRSAAQVYRLARISPRTGAVLSETTLGVGPLADTLQMVGTILPDGTLLQGSIGGVSVVRRGAP